MDAVLEQTIRRRMEDEKARTAPPPDAIPVPPIPTRRYTDPRFFELEMDHIFRRNWLFAGHVSEWPDAGLVPVVHPVRMHRSSSSAATTECCAASTTRAATGARRSPGTSAAPPSG